MSAIAGKTFLIVEARVSDATARQETIHAHGGQALVAATGQDAVTELRNRDDINLVLMDVELGATTAGSEIGGPQSRRPDIGAQDRAATRPGRPPLDAAESARRILEIRPVPIVFLTYHPDIDEVERLEGIRRYGFVPANAGEPVLIASITTALELFEAHRTAETASWVAREREKELSCFFGLSELVDTPGSNLRTIGRGLPDVLARGWQYPEAARARVEFGDEVYEHPDFGDSVCVQKEAIHVDGRAFGSVAIGYVTPTPESEEGAFLFSERRLLRALAERLGRIAERLQARDNLRHEEFRLNAIIEGTNVGTWEWNVQTGEARFNDRWAAIAGYTLEELQPVSIKTWEVMTHPDDLAHCEAELQRHFRGETTHYECECRMRHKEGHWVWVLDRGKVATWTEESRPLWMYGTHQDITERRKLLQYRDQEIRERDTLMRELNHRVKNNLNLVSSLISMKEAALDGVDLSDIRYQVRVIQTMHDKLFGSGAVTSVSLRDYVQDFLPDVLSFFRGPVEVETDIEPREVPTRVAVSIGLLINELATNAMKYGFVAGRKNRFSVHFHAVEEGMTCQLVVSNSGNPFPEDVDPAEAGTLGFQLVMALVRQLDGTLSLDRTPETCFTIRFAATAGSAATESSTATDRGD